MELKRMQRSLDCEKHLPVSQFAEEQLQNEGLNFPKRETPENSGFCQSSDGLSECHANVGQTNAQWRCIDAVNAETGADELMIVSDVFEHRARIRSLELIADAAGGARPVSY